MSFTIPGGSEVVFRFERTEERPGGFVGTAIEWGKKTLYGIALVEQELRIIRQRGGKQTVIASAPVTVNLHTKYWIRFKVKPDWIERRALLIRARLWQDQSNDEDEESAWNTGELDTWTLEVEE